MMFPEPPRTVKPRRMVTTFLPIIAVSQEDRIVYVERTGERHPITELPNLLLAEPSSLVVTHDAAALLLELTRVFDPATGSDPHPDWQFRVTPVKRTFHKDYNPDKQSVTTLDTVVGFFGWAPPRVVNKETGEVLNRRVKRKGRYFYPVDPFQFAKRGVRTLVPDTRAVARVDKMLAWGMDIREWCNSQSLRIAATPGGIAGQLLRDPRFYPTARRKVPRVTNDRARLALPGNHYRLYADTYTRYNAHYLDMAAAHHNCAAIITFPHADTLNARGRFKFTDTTLTTAIDGSAWAPIGTHHYDHLLTAHGLFLLHLTVPKIPDTQFPLPALETPGRRLAFVYSNELALVREQGAVIDGIEAAWVSWQTDPGLNHYAQWALTETATVTPARKTWLKPLLLATYGLLASKPRLSEFGYGQALGGVPTHYPTGTGFLPVKAKQADKLIDMATANVIHRGMIEAECRAQTIRLARTLTGHGLRVLQLYADSIMVEQGPLPLLPAPWTIKDTLTNLVFFDPTSFVADELHKLPGIPERHVRHYITARLKGVSANLAHPELPRRSVRR